MKDSKITVSKGLGITLMVIGHSVIPLGVDYIYMFHMPLFFILSGYCFIEAHLNDFKNFFIRRIKGLYKPFVLFGIIFILLHNVFYHLNIYNEFYGYSNNVSHLYTIKESINKVIKCLLMYGDSEELLGGYWFLPQLFWASIIGWILIKVFHNPLAGLLVAVALSIVFMKFELQVPYTRIHKVSFMATSFFLIGFAIKKYRVKVNGWQAVDCAIIVLLGSVFFKSDMYIWNIKTVLPFLACATLGSLMIIRISSFEHNIFKKPLIYIGDHTMEILTWHFLSFKLASLLIILVEMRTIDELSQFPVIQDQTYPFWWLLYIIVGLGIPLGLVYLRYIIKRRIISHKQI